MILTDLIKSQWRSWVHHTLIAGGLTVVLGVFGLWLLGAWGGFFFYLGREVRDYEIERPNVTLFNYLDHVGDLAGPSLILLVVWLVTR